jgi:WD40 repeat protein
MQISNVTKIAQFNGHTGSVYSVCKGAMPNTFYTGGNDGMVVAWNTQKPDEGKLLVRVNRPVYSLYLDAERNWLFCGTASGNLHLIDLAEGKEIRNLEAHQLGIFDIQFAEGYLYTSGGDGHVLAWSLPDLTIHYRGEHSNKSARAIALHPTQQKMAVGYSDFHIRILALPSLTVLNDIDAHQNSVFAVAYNVTGEELFSGGRDVQLKSWVVNKGYELDIDIPAHTLHINQIAFTPSGNLFATVSMDKTIKIWATENVHLLKVIDKARNNGHASSVNKCLWIDDETLLTVSDDRTIMMWKMELID